MARLTIRKKNCFLAMEGSFLITALLTGLVGSLHCIGMCGPIAIALPLQKHNWFWKTTGGILYNLGRALTYGILGLIFGIFGKGLAMAGFQQWASITIGIIMIVGAIAPIVFNRLLNFEKLIYGQVGGLISRLRKLFTNQSMYALFLIGFLNGLLPCGLVYAALSGALLSGGLVNGAIYMIVFGLGTLPVMLGVNLAGNFISIGFRNKLKKIVPVFLILLGALFILRGMNLGIKFISPPSQKLQLEAEEGGKSCH
jgi:sulfite exporter TauE/SafE